MSPARAAGDATLEGRFRSAAGRKLGFLESGGFKRAPDLETSSPTLATVAWLGRHVALIVGLDLRDLSLDAEVARVEDGRIRRTSDGGFSSDLYGFLVGRLGYRGPAWPRPLSAETLDKSLDELAALLRGAAAPLLADREDSLPR